MLLRVKYIELSKRKILNNANINPYFKIAIEPEKPTSESSNGLQNGQAAAKKLSNIPLTPVVVEAIFFCFSLKENTCKETKIPPKIDNIMNNDVLCHVNTNLILDKPNLTSIKFVIIEKIIP